MLGLDVDAGEDTVGRHPAQQPETGDAAAGADLDDVPRTDRGGEETQRRSTTGPDRADPDLGAALARSG
jgi:hypothetical protein